VERIMSEGRCPICDKPSERKFAPFCSRRCADVDLSRWLRGGYAVPGRPLGEEDDGGPESPKNGGAKGPD
jgi:endogenous inhibitor of DNA gyrase (YacG/DUF329 family)